MSKRKILIITEVFYPENGLINDFVQELKKKDYAVEVLTQHPSYPQSYIYEGYKNENYCTENWDGVLIHRFKFIEGYKNSIVKKILNYITFAYRGSQIAKNIGNMYDYVLVYQTGPLTVALPAIAIKKKFGKKVLIWTLDIWPDAVFAYGFPKIFPLTFFLEKLIKKIYKNCDSIFVSSKGFIEQIQKYAPNIDVEYAPNWVVKESYARCRINLDTNYFNFTFTGNISIAQNLKNVLLGWQQAQLKDSILNIVGEGSYLETLQKIVLDKNIKNVIFHGSCPSNQIQDILSQSDFLILPLIDDEGIAKTEPYKIQSYLLSKKPILGIVNGGAKEIIEVNRLGLCATPSDINSIAATFKEAIYFSKDEYNLNVVQSAAEELLSNRFNREKIINKVITLMEK